jgi:hypothetical protein
MINSTTQSEKCEPLVMAKSVETFNLSNDISRQELAEYQKQKRDIDKLSILTAGTIEYENAIQKVMDLLPSKSIIKEFNEKEKMRLDGYGFSIFSTRFSIKSTGHQVALQGLDVNLEKKLKSHDAIID